jgi:putative FmdB family regulatory protein
MAIYEYRCEHCDDNIERYLKMDEAKSQCVLFCKVCKSSKTFKKSIGNSGGFILKGKGWFSDGYQTKGS